MHLVRLNPATGIAHCRIQQPDRLSALIRTFDATIDLLRFGAVYVDGRRATEDRELAPGSLVRVHTRPKRYAPRSSLVIVRDHPEFLVIDKPSGLPTHPTLDNVRENALHILTAQLERPVFVTHRLDIPTRGLLIFAKSAAAQALINKSFAKNRVEKLYLARSGESVPLGEHRHFIDPESHVPRAISTEPRPNWWECRLVVEEARADGDGWVHRVRLLTGKTHQIRAQFAALGAPLAGDLLYGGEPADTFGLSCERLKFPYRTEVIDVRR